MIRSNSSHGLREPGALAPGPRAAPADRCAAERLPASEPYDPHGGLNPLFAAARRTRARVAVVPVRMHWVEGRFRSRPLELLAKAATFLGPHLRLARTLWRLRDHDLVVVREFLTQILVLVWPLVWPLRRRVRFLVNHNLQEAHERRFERALLRLLWRAGCRFACLESPAGFAELGMAPIAERVLVLPHPIGALAPRRPRPADAAPVVGVVGEIRPEKGSLAILETLVALRAAGRLDARLLLGCPDARIRERWRAEGFEVIDTTTPEAYQRALAAADVLILNYRRDRYYFRASGVAADAVTWRTAVVAPDFPIIRHMLEVPAPVGATFEGLDQLGDALDAALALLAAIDDAFEAHARTRSAAAIAARLDDAVREGAGRPGA